MPAFHVDRKTHVGYVLSSGGTRPHAVAPHPFGLLRKGARLLGRSLCDRTVEVRDVDTQFNPESPEPDFCKRCLTIAKQMNGTLTHAA